MEANGGVRVQKVLAQAGLGSRRACDGLVAEGRVSVNGHTADLGTRVDPALDVISVDGRPISVATDIVVLALNKPFGVVTTMADDRGRPCVGDMVRDFPQRLFHVGRLDEETEGLLLLTNDGDLAHLLMHPSHGVEKTYLAEVRGRVTPGTVRRLLVGVELADGPARADRALVQSSTDQWSVIELVIHEGRKRIVRRMLKAVGHPVERLMRTAIGTLELGSLAPGAFRILTSSETRELTELAHR